MEFTQFCSGGGGQMGVDGMHNHKEDLIFKILNSGCAAGFSVFVVFTFIYEEIVVVRNDGSLLHS
jgi:hypothetical protein